MVSYNLQDWPGDDETNEVEFRYLCGNTDHSGALEEAGIIEADAIIIVPADDLSDNEVRQSLSLLTLFHSCACIKTCHPHCVLLALTPAYLVPLARHVAISPAVSRTLL